MAITETETLKTEIEKHQKALENYEWLPYALKLNNQVYYAARYIRFKKEKGLLILSKDGNVIEHEEAVQACELLVHYYSAVSFIERIIVPLTERPVWQFEELLSLMDELKEDLTGVKGDVHVFRTVLQRLLANQTRLQEIENEMRAIDNKVDKQGYVLVEDVKKMQEYLRETKRIQYDGARKQLDVLDQARQISDFLEPWVDKGKEPDNAKINRLDELLRAYSHKAVLKKLKQNKKQFEITPEGKHVPFSEGERGMQEMLDNFDQLSEQQMRTKVLPLVRN